MNEKLPVFRREAREPVGRSSAPGRSRRFLVGSFSHRFYVQALLLKSDGQ